MFQGIVTMKQGILIAVVASAFTVLSVWPIAAMPLLPLSPTVTSQLHDDVITVKHGGRGHHYGWTKSRGLHLGFVRGRHRGWY
jgi:hypothetical protein